MVARETSPGSAILNTLTLTRQGMLDVFSYKNEIQITEMSTNYRHYESTKYYR